MNATKIVPVRDKNQAIWSYYLDPDWHNEDFKRPQTVFLDPEFKTVRRGTIDFVENVRYFHSDRLQEWHGDKCKEAKDAAKRKVKENSAAFFEAFLQILLEKPNLRVVHILSSTKADTGSSYRTFGYIEE